MTERAEVDQFFDEYRRGLLARDTAAVAGLYAVPALIAFPAQSLAVADRSQTEAFFASAWEQYDGVDDVTSEVRVVAETGHSVWADVTWRYGDGRTERFMYQLVQDGDAWRIAVLTPLTS
ncbi:MULTISPECIES: nuclear transport factor 2 family protein [Cellulomonas]|uniref:nuclear transport factor 2 family protein n=1 Tax=Cellulomonas TaxID=1707 RepID=UPI0014562EF5|nr:MULTISPECIES: nuclear transport factor 2 family protein [Cellulomonas]